MKWRTLLVAAGLPALVLGGGKPSVADPYKLENLPYVVFYFEDSKVVLAFDDRAGDVLRSEDDGKTWAIVDDVKGKARDILEHPFDKERAFIFGGSDTHWTTKDRGKSWQSFTADLPVSYSQSALSFHAENPDYVLYAGRDCDPDDFFGLTCTDTTFYTKDWFKNLEPLREKNHGCLWARGTKHFKEASENTVLCVVDGKDRYMENRRLAVSDNFFKKEEEPLLDGYMKVEGMAGIAAVQKFIVAAARSRGTDEMALYVTDDAKIWHRAIFPDDHGGLKEDAYTILESTPYSIQVDVLTTKPYNPMGELFTSNSNGTYFTRDLDYTNRIMEGLVDFEQIEGIQGIVMANVVKNFAEVNKNSKTQKQVASKISFDDGKLETWHDLKVEGENKPLHLHSVTRLTNGGRVFSSAAPGIVMGVGNVGDYLDDYMQGDLYISDDAGRTWSRALKEAHQYSFGGSGSVVIAVFDEGPTSKFSYSINHGKDWEEYDFGLELRVRLLTTTPDATSLKFLIIGINSKEKESYSIAIDFSDVLSRKCSKDDGDFEKWYARLNEDGQPDCLMGHKQYYWRRKKDADCNAGKLFDEPEVEQEICACERHDFECDFNFVKKGDDCVLAANARLPIPRDECKKPEDKFWGTNGYRKIPGNTCKDGLDLEKEVEHDCKDAQTGPQHGDIEIHEKEFKGEPEEYFYLDNGQSQNKYEETVVMRTSEQEVWFSHNHGETWEQPEELKGVEIFAIYPNTYFYDNVYFITASKTVYFTPDRGQTIKKMEVPSPPNVKRLPVMDFNRRKEDDLIWTGQRDCSAGSLKCQSVAYYTKSRGEKWEELTNHAGTCRWINSPDSDHLVFCERYADTAEGQQAKLVASHNFFDDEKVHFEHIIGFATMEEFIVVASITDDGQSLKASASIDGKTFADAHFPHNFNVPHQTAYTVLDSVTHAVFLHVTVNENEGHEFGSLLKSNSNGTNYVLSMDAVNRNHVGYVDFEKLHSMEGVALINRVENHEDVAKGQAKRLRSYITHNDGGEWNYIPAPTKDSEGKAFSCSGSLQKCSLNLHSYTERTDPRHTYASQSAVGLMMGVGNVGDALQSFSDGDTFLTSDGGLTWNEVKKGQYLWEYGDQGSIIVIVNRAKETDHVLFSLDEGITWEEYSFGQSMMVTDLSTVPTDTSRRFLLWGYKQGGGNNFKVIQLDFSKLTDLKCVLAKEDSEKDNDDFELWAPKENGEERCLFGHVAQYNRKIPDHRCYIGEKIPQPAKILQNCTCTERDFECDFNYERQSDGTCKLVDGYPEPDHAAVCKDNNAREYWKPTGYRRLPMTTCENGKELDKIQSVPCPGWEEQWRKKHGGLRGFGLFLAIVFPIAAAAGIGYFVWTRVLNGSMGAIRLGEDHGDNPLIRYPIIAISAIVAVIAAIPTILSTVGGWLSSKFTRTRRFTTRSSFARGDYSIVNNDEGELLGSDDEDEV